ncbi:g2612 [Coccomyxa viridis]|uniref:G2612 protein n=1 Tax=Coccomyxa viridis TaxID=1274662 RepID=A0ABP1FN33_9CHLO
MEVVSQAPAGGKTADTEESQQVPAVKTPAEVKEVMQSIEASVEQFTEMLGELEEETRALLAQLTAVFNNLMELETEVVADIKENRGILKTATERHEKAGELHKESRRLLDEARKERAARPQYPWWITVLDFVSNQLWWLGVYLVFCGLKQGK